MQAHVQTYQELGAEVLGITAQRATKAEKYRTSHGLTIPILIDPDRTVIKRYGVYHRIGLTALNIARPAAIIIDREGRIRFMYVGADQVDWPDHATLVAELQKLRP